MPAETLGIALGALGGAAVGVEREWSGHASGPASHFAGIRTFTLLGGLISSTSVTLSFSRTSSAQPKAQVPLALGVVAASTMLYFRVVGASFFLNPALGKALILLLAAPAVLGAVFTAYGLRRWESGHKEPRKTMNPLQFRSALQMAVLFQVVLFLVTAARQRWGETGLVLSGAVLGFTDVDALVISMAKAASSSDQIWPAIGATSGILANNVLKLGLAAFLGRGRFRSLAVVGLAMLAIATALSIAYFR